MNEDLLAELYDSIPSFIESIDNVIEGITSVKGSYVEQARDLLTKCLNIYPKIIKSYTDDRLLSYAEDVEYWTGLLSKTIQIFKDTDRFKIIDVLYFEMKPSMIEYKSLLEKMGLG